MSKPSRAKNVSEEEKLILMDIVSCGERVQIVESKQYDAESIKKKNETWKKIETEFNSRSPISREIKQLSKMWRDMKKRAKDVRTEQKRESRLTGGGKNPVRIDPVSEAAISLLPRTSFEPLTGVNDSDALLHEEKGDIENGECLDFQLTIFYTGYRLYCQFLFQKKKVPHWRSEMDLQIHSRNH